MKSLASINGRCGMRLGLVLGMLLAPALASAANEYPTKLIRLIVPVAPGGPTDMLARALAEAMTMELGQSVVVENRSGAGGVAAYGMVASAEPDGYTLGLVENALTVQPSLQDNLAYDVEKHLTPISSVARGPTVLLVRKGLAVTTLAELVALAKRSPGELNFGSAGIGTPPHLNGELFKTAQDIDIRHIPYRGAAPAITDLLAERIDIMFLNIGAAKSYVESGNLRGLAIGSKTRAPALPKLPTFYEASFPVPELDTGTWWDVVGPAKLSSVTTARLNEAVTKVLNAPQFKKFLSDMSLTPEPSTSAEFGALIASERRKWAEFIKKSGIKKE